jgi:tRNA-specific 2-thiouridylase
MVRNGKKVFVALSGGVDSSTSAAVLLEAGYDCTGVFMVTSEHSSHKDAEDVARRLGIKFYILDLRNDFERILDYFCDEYKGGRTPNPCILCNRLIKFGKLWDFARSKGAELLATGHYAKILKHNGQFGLYEAAYTAKDQSYALSMIDSRILSYIILPMEKSGSKDQTREMAAKFGLGNAQKAESQEICFIPDNDYTAVLEHRCPELVHGGNITDSDGNILGEHSGIHKFTIGQRRGLRIAMGKPYYVVNIDAQSKTVTLGPKEELVHKRLYATDVNWLIDAPKSAFRARVKIRYNDKGDSALVSPQGNNVVVEFDEPKPAITPGQIAAFYVQEGKNNRVVGAGWIDKASD